MKWRLQVYRAAIVPNHSQMVRLGFQPLPSNTDWIGTAYALIHRTLIRVYFGVKEGLKRCPSAILNKVYIPIYLIYHGFSEKNRSFAKFFFESSKTLI